MNPPLAKQSAVIVGVDEAGRGALAGPVVAASCQMPSTKIQIPILIQDSKTLSPLQRELSFQWITKNCAYGIGSADHTYIDTHGILEATQLAIDQAMTMLERTITPAYVLMDGRDRFWFNYPNTKIIRGDSSEVCIAAASIIAKVSRDRWMINIAKKFPQYGFEIHKGYGTEGHFAMIEKYGLCPMHRRTFGLPPQPSPCQQNTHGKKLPPTQEQYSGINQRIFLDPNILEQKSERAIQDQE